jgi:hypothetical protein
MQGGKKVDGVGGLVLTVLLKEKRRKRIRIMRDMWLDRELAEQDSQERDEWLIELEWEQMLLDAWEAMQPQPVDDEPLANSEIEPF